MEILKCTGTITLHQFLQPVQQNSPIIQDVNLLNIHCQDSLKNYHKTIRIVSQRGSQEKTAI